MLRNDAKIRFIVLLIMTLLISQCSPRPTDTEQPAPAAAPTDTMAAATVAPSSTPLPSPTVSPTPVIGPDAAFDSSNICDCRLMAELGKGNILDIAVSPANLQASLGGGKVARAVMAPADTYLAAATGNGVRLFNTKTMDELSFTQTRDFASLVAIAPGNDAVVYSQRNDIAVAPIENGNLGEPKYFEGHTDSVNSLAYMADGRVITSSYDKTLRIWDVSNGGSTVVEPLETNVRQVAPYGKDGFTTLTSGYANNKSFTEVTFWSAPAGQDPQQMNSIKRGGYFKSFDIAADGKIALAGSSYPNGYEILDAKGTLLNSEPADDKNPFLSVAFSPDSSSLALGGFNSAIGGPVLKDKTWFFNSTSGPVKNVAFSPDSKSVFFTSPEGLYRVDSASGQLLNSVTGFNAAINDLHFDNGSLNSSAYGSIFNKHLDYQSFYMQDTLKVGNITANIATRFDPNSNNVPVFSPDGQYFASLLGSHKAGVFDLKSGSEVSTIDFGSNNYIHFVSYLSPNQLFVGGYEYSYLYNPFTGEPIGPVTLTQSGDKDLPMNTYVSGDGRMAFFGTFMGHVKVYDIQGGKQTGDLLLEGNENPYIYHSSVTANQDGSLVIVGIGNNLYAWQLEGSTWSNLWSQKTDSVVDSALLLPDDLSVLAGLSSGEVAVYDTKDGSKKCGLLKVGPAPVTVMKYSKDGRTLGFGSTDGMIRLLGTT